MFGMFGGGGGDDQPELLGCGHTTCEHGLCQHLVVEVVCARCQAVGQLHVSPRLPETMMREMVAQVPCPRCRSTGLEIQAIRTPADLAGVKNTALYTATPGFGHDHRN